MLSDRHQHFLSSALLAGNARQLPRGKYRDELLSGERVFLAVRQARLGRESHWQSPVLRKDRHKTCNARGIRSLSGAASRQQLRKETGHDCAENTASGHRSRAS